MKLNSTTMRGHRDSENINWGKTLIVAVTLVIVPIVAWMFATLIENAMDVKELQVQMKNVIQKIERLERR